MLTNQEIIARYYVGYYNRAPDPAGFDFWVTNFENGISTLEIANFFADQVETRALYPYFADPANNTPEQFVRSVYDNLFNRDPDDAGLAFWMNELTTGSTETGAMIEAIIAGATTNPDLAVVENKVASALYWEDQANNFSDFAYNDTAATSANAALSGVTDDVATVGTSQAQANEYFAQLSDDKGDPGAGLTDDGSEDDKVEIASTGTVNNGEVSISTAVSDPVINLGAFRDDPRFAGIDGSGQTIVIIDTGIDLNHPAFGPDNDGNGISDRIIFARDFTNEGDGTADDEQGHGSNVASIAASSAGDYTGVAPGANIVALQALDRTGSGSSFGIEDALQWVVQNAEALNIVSVNMSLGDSSNNNFISTHPVYGDELAVLNDQLGVTTIVAAGNAYQDFQREGASSLSIDPNTIAIGAVGGSSSSGGDITFFSQRSDDVPTIFAPGSFVEGAAPGGGTSESSGTSQAAPHVAGMVALAQQLAQQELGRTLTPDEFAQLLQQSGDTFVDDENSNDRVVNTGATYTRADMFDLAEAILELGGNAPIVTPPGGGGGGGGDTGDIPGTIGTTARIDVDTTQTSTIGFDGDEDYFAVDLTAGEYTISMNGVGSGGGTLSDPFLTLLSASGAYLTGNDDGGTGLDSLIEFVVSQDGTYFINASAYGSATGTYSLTVDRTGGATGDIGETAGSAANLAINSSVNSALDFGADRDWFAVSLTAGQTYTFDMVGDTLADPYLFLFDANGTVVAANDDGGEGFNSSLVFNAGTTATYYVSAEAYSAFQTGTYTLTATGQATDADDYADNPGTGGFLQANGGSQTGTLEDVGDRDWFRVDLESGSTYEFSLSGNSLSDTYMYLYDSAGNQIGFDDDGGAGLDSFLTFTADSSGAYYIGAAAFGDFYEGSYTLTSTQTGQSAGDVPSDPSTPVFLQPGQTITGVLDAPGDTDWYGVNLVGGEVYQFNLNSAGGNPMNDPYLALYDQNGGFVGENDDFFGLNSQITFEVFTSGRWYIAAEAYDLSTDSGTYELSLTTTGGFNGFF